MTGLKSDLDDIGIGPVQDDSGGEGRAEGEFPGAWLEADNIDIDPEIINGQSFHHSCWTLQMEINLSRKDLNIIGPR